MSRGLKNILKPVYKLFLDEAEPLLLVLTESYRRDKKPLSVESCWSDLPPRELLLGFGVVEYFGGYLMNRRSSSFLIHLRSLVIAVMAQAFVTRGLKQVYSSNLLVTLSKEENNQEKTEIHLGIRNRAITFLAMLDEKINDASVRSWLS